MALQQQAHFLGQLRGGTDFCSFSRQWQAKTETNKFLWELKGCQDLCSYLLGQQQTRQEETPAAAPPAADASSAHKHDQQKPSNKGIVATMCKQIEAKLQATRPDGYWMARQLDSSRPIMKPACH